MGDPPLMRGRQSLRDLMTPVEHAADFQLALIQPFTQRRSLEQLHDRIQRPIFRPEIMNGQYVRMRERRDRARLPLEPRQRLVAVRSAEKNLDGHIALQPPIARPPHLAHAASTDSLDDLVGAELRTDIHSQMIRRHLQNAVSPVTY